MDREGAIAIGLTWLKGPRDKPYLEVARALDYLRGLPEFRTNKAVGQRFGVSGEIVREFLSLLSLPENVQQMISDKKLRLDQGTKLASLLRRSPTKFAETAEVLTGVPAEDARDIIDFILRNPDKSVAEAKRLVLGAKPQIEDAFHVVAILAKDEFSILESEARRFKVSPSRMVSQIIQSWLKEHASREP